jgi:hypothetical protein
MSFKRLDPEDFVVSSDSITSTLWSNNVPVLTSFFTSSVQEAGSSGNFYLSVYQTASNLSNAEIQFDIVYCDSLGSGSEFYNDIVELQKFFVSLIIIQILVIVSFNLYISVFKLAS